MHLPEKTIRRLTLYYYILIDYIQQEKNTITSSQIAMLLKIDDSQVRKDIGVLDNTGKGRIGYSVVALKESIENTLGLEEPKAAVIIGAGNLGAALAKYDDFGNYGLNVKALFDTDPLKLGITINSKPVFHISELENYSKEMNIEIAVLTVPRMYAQKVVDMITLTSIKYIWNFSPAILKTPKEILVWNENLMGSFLQFTYSISQNELSGMSKLSNSAES
ncbi:MAG: redox-sensing transcriptional repressor Rex [Brevinema sp.]